MKRQVFIAHADGEQAQAEQLAEPLEEAGYEVIHQGTVLVGDSIVAAAQKVLEAGGPVVLCATVRAVGTKWPHQLVRAWRKSARGHVYVVQMEEEAFVESLAFGEKVVTWWEERTRARREFLDALKVHYPLDEASSAEAELHGAERRYRQLALESCDIINLANLPEGDRHLATRKLELRRLYVPLRVRLQVPSEDEPSEARLLALEKQREGWRRGTPEPDAVERFPVGERLERARRLVVLGDPGAGKSTLIRWLATAYLLKLKRDPDWRDLPDISTLPDREWLPVIIRCRDLDPSSLRGSLDDVLRHTFRKTEMSDAEAEALGRLLRRKLEQGEALLLIDGLDEISEPGARIRFCEQIERICVAFPDAPIVVTSRIVGYREMGGQRIGRGFEHVTVDDLAHEDKDEFVRRWCAMTELPERRAISEEELLKDIHSTDRIERLTGNPMLLTTMALVKRKVGKLPRYRAELYWQAVQVLLNWRQAEMEEPLDNREALPQLGFLAYAMCERGVQRLRQDEVYTLLEQIRAEYPNLHDVRNHTPAQFVTLLERRTGILIEAGHEKHLGMTVPVYEFRHLTFQEYLAARALVERCFPSPPARSLAENIAPLARKVVETLAPIARQLTDKTEVEPSVPDVLTAVSWDEVFRLCVAICQNQDVDSVLMAILEPLRGEDDSQTAVVRAVLAAFCLVDEPNASDEVVRQILRRLVERIEFQDMPGVGEDPELLGALTQRTSVFFLLKETRWAGELAHAFAREFRSRGPGARNGIHYVWSSIGLGVEPSQQGGISSFLSRLLSPDEIEVIEAALTLSRQYLNLGEIPSIDGEELVALVERGGAVSHAAAMALENLSGAFWGGMPWSPTPAQVERLIAVLASDTVDTGTVVRLMDILGHHGVNAAVEPIITRLESKMPELRWTAANALGAIKDARAVTPLVRAAEDPEPVVRHAAVAALGNLGDARVVGVLRGMLQDPDEELRRSVVAALSMLPGAEALDALREASKDRSVNVRRPMLWRLGELKKPEDVELMILLLEDPNISIRIEAIRLLASLKSPAAVGPLLAYLKGEPKQPGEDDFLSMAQRRDGFFTEGFLDERLLLAEAALALVGIGDRSAAEPLQASSDEIDADVRPVILHALGHLGDARTVEFLFPILHAPESRMRLAAAEALARLGDERGRKFLLQQLSSEEARERTSALELLVGLHPEQEVDSRLLSIHDYRITYFMDPRDVVDDARLQQIQEQMGIPPDEARRGFESIVQRIPLKLSWRE